jgi:hypothetical protein
MSHQHHDIGHRKLRAAQELARERAPKKSRGRGKKTARSPARFADWCRTPNHPPNCSCAY